MEKTLDNGPQPLDALMTEMALANHSLVDACKVEEGLTHKAVQRARKGRRLTPKMKIRITDAFNVLLKTQGDERQFAVKQLFNY